MRTSYKFYVEAYTVEHTPMLGLDHNRVFYNRQYHNTWWYYNFANTKPRSMLIAYYKITSVNNTDLIGCDKAVRLEEYLVNTKYLKDLESFIKKAEASGVKVNYINCRTEEFSKDDQ